MSNGAWTNPEDRAKAEGCTCILYPGTDQKVIVMKSCPIHTIEDRDYVPWDGRSYA